MLASDIDGALCADVGVFVDESGKRTRKQEIMWPGVPVAASTYFSLLSAWMVDWYNFNVHLVFCQQQIKYSS